MKMLASLSLDLDNQWSYMKTHGDAGWDSYPSYLDVVVPRVLDFLAARGLRITFFVVGQDAALDRNHDALAALSRAGHEIGNHSFRHEPWLHLYSEAELEKELTRAEDAIESATGVHPTGFRGPGYSLSETTLRVLVRRGYRYDASTLPTYLGPLARAFYFRSARLDDEQRRERSQLFGTWRDGARPVGPYRWSVDGTTLLELPVTTMPVAKVPIHVSYLLYLSAYSPALARAYFRGALAMCRAARVGPSILLHPLDFLAADDVDALAFFPGMDLPLPRKLDTVAMSLDLLTNAFDVRPVGEHAAALDARTDLRTVQPRFDYVPEHDGAVSR
ncbi:MAG TPA: polysaccharide deacetylase family protein [Acidimicrobiia bacterium]|nr:polysaccharide deacetylase family protein [Acidimicrobiia bacterium]